MPDHSTTLPSQVDGRISPDHQQQSASENTSYVVLRESHVSLPTTTSHRVSVVVATYNRPESLQQLVNDLVVQRVPQPMGFMQLVVVDDGGADEILPAFPAVVPFDLIVVRQPNGGPASARHLGVSLSNGEVVVIVDDDMRVASDFVAQHVEAHAAGSDVVYGLIEGHSSIGPLFARYHQMHIDRWLQECRAGVTPRGERLCTGNVSFSRRAYDGVGGFDTSLIRCEDRDLGIRFEQAGFQISYCEAALSTHASGIDDTTAWRKRNEIYGASDVVISEKHPDSVSLSPWAFLDDLPRVVHPLLVAVAIVPGLSRVLGRLVYSVGAQLDRVGRERVGLRLAGLTYGIDYYGGAGRKWGTAARAWTELRTWRTKSRAESTATARTPGRSASESSPAGRAS
jgi:GT2 family glycosyltransferase